MATALRSEARNTSVPRSRRARNAGSTKPAATAASTAVPPAETWQLAHAQAELGRLTETAGEDAGTVLSLAEVTALLAEAFRGRPGRS